MKKIMITAVTLMCALMMLLFSGCGEGTAAIINPVRTESVNKTEKEEKKAVKPTVIIDPGHGFRDPGSIPEYINGTEADITLSASLMLKEVLEKRDIPCIMTHDGTKYIDEISLRKMADSLKIEYDAKQIVEDDKFSPYERSVYENVLARRYANCFFISIHTNAVEYAPNVKGASIDWYEKNPNSEQLAGFADSLSEGLKDSPGTTLKIFEDNYNEAYIVTKYSDIPSVLIELGYGTNSEEASNLQNPFWVKKFVSSIADSIEEYYRQ